MATLSSVLPPVSVSTASGILPVGNGGTGANELTLDNVLLGNGSSAPKVVAPGTAGNVLTSNGTTWASSPAAGGSITATASGSIPAGAPVIVNAGGSVATPTQTVSIVTPPTVGSYFSTTSETAGYVDGINYDSSGGRVIVVFRDSSNGYLYAVIGTISGDVITWGTPTVIFSSFAIVVAVQGIDSSRTMVVFNTTANPKSAVIISHASSTISVGTPATAYTTTAFSRLAAANTSVHLASNSRVYALARANGAPSQWFLTSIEYSGTSIISYNQQTDYFGPSSANNAQIATDNTKIVVHFISNSVTNAVIKVGTISGSSITWSAEQTVATSVRNGTTYGSSTGIAYNSNSGSWIAIYYTTGYFVGVKLFTISGSTATFGSETLSSDSKGINLVTASSGTNNFVTFLCGTSVFEFIPRTIYSISGLTASVTTNTATLQIGAEFPHIIHIGGSRFLLISRTQSGLNVTGSIITPTSITDTLSDSRYAGISSGSYTDGQTATINIAGSVNTAISGLTAGTVYYVNPSGGLQTTAGNPSVLAGVALSSTSLLVK